MMAENSWLNISRQITRQLLNLNDFWGFRGGEFPKSLAPFWGDLDLPRFFAGRFLVLQKAEVLRSEFQINVTPISRSALTPDQKIYLVKAKHKSKTSIVHTLRDTLRDSSFIYFVYINIESYICIHEGRCLRFFFTPHSSKQLEHWLPLWQSSQLVAAVSNLVCTNIVCIQKIENDDLAGRATSSMLPSASNTFRQMQENVS